jgi:hypothetical protein
MFRSYSFVYYIRAQTLFEIFSIRLQTAFTSVHRVSLVTFVAMDGESSVMTSSPRLTPRPLKGDWPQITVTSLSFTVVRGQILANVPEFLRYAYNSLLVSVSCHYRFNFPSWKPLTWLPIQILDERLKIYLEPICGNSKFILKRHVVFLNKYYLTIKQSTQQLFYISEMSH